ncbi:restriction endonuclease subunit S [Clostridium tyrobutyricum]|uniref:restriction endonuclease subunit S n=1 Tax=Clostridium tyrobutyricum TaxID=1519 RepID=UPI001C3932C4|nr:restriction endonuclease subunit S [Clostridium tyrobutyricum]MBV4440503.1 restriction endonuclease subunit S [Clostridium tyrobutyricum]
MVKISELFNMYQGNGFELTNMILDDKSKISFVSRTSQNNGIVAKVKEYKDIKPFPAGFITVALGGSVLETFVQKNNFYTSYHVMILEPKTKMTFIEKQYYAMCIKANKFRYSYGRQANKTLKDIDLPTGVPDWVYKYNVNPSFLHSYKINNFNKKSKWGTIKLIDYFHMKSGTYYEKSSYIKGNVPLVSASNTENGVLDFTNLVPKFSENAITIGKIGAAAYYQNKPFCATSDVTILIPKKNCKLDKFTGLFIITLINMEKIKWSYGRQIRLNDCKKLEINLPIDSNKEPYWTFMKEYMKSLPYSEYI